MAERIQLGDTPISSTIKLSEGNPGAVVACKEMMINAPTIDPDSVWGALGPLLGLDRSAIYGHYIWNLYKDVCKQSTALSLAMLRCVQMGILPETELLNAIKQDSTSYKPMSIERIQEVYYALKKELPNFDRNGEGEKVWKSEK